MFSAGRRPLKPTEKGGRELLDSLVSKQSCGDSLPSNASDSTSSARPAAKKARSGNETTIAIKSVPTSDLRSNPDSDVQVVQDPLDVPSDDELPPASRTISRQSSMPDIVELDVNDESAPQQVTAEDEAKMSKISIY